MRGGAALGVDWYRGAWVGVVLADPQPPQVLVETDLGRLVDRVADPACVGVDMPIGLPATEREADRLAREFVGPRWPSVFMTPPDEVLRAPSYAEANVIAARLLGGRKISQQAWALRRNIEHVGNLAARDPRLIEAHPEVSFRDLAGAPLTYAKTTWNGQAIRRRALRAAGIVLADDLGEAGRVPVADVLDAAVVAWAARRYAEGAARSLPPGAERGERQVIWY